MKPLQENDINPIGDARERERERGGQVQNQTATFVYKGIMSAPQIPCEVPWKACGVLPQDCLRTRKAGLRTIKSA